MLATIPDDTWNVLNMQLAWKVFPFDDVIMQPEIYLAHV